MSNIKEYSDDKINSDPGLEKLHRKKIQVNEDKIAICEWYSYNGRRCRRTRPNDGDFCDYHDVIKDDYKILDNKKETEHDCFVKKDIKIMPRNKTHIVGIMDKLNYDKSDVVDIFLSGGSVEEGSIENDDYIELSIDDTKFYYENKKGFNKAKNLRIMLTEYCDKKGIVSVKGDVYCQDCYVKTSKKLGYPNLKLFGYEIEE
jgi:hypothetical protein